MKIKALFLLFTFLLNSAVGLNCALHKDSDCCDESAEQHHQVQALQSRQINQSITIVSQEESCCQNAVNSFASLAKLVPQSVKAFMPIPAAYLRASYPHNLKLQPLPTVDHQLLIDERQRPPTPDIRIVIQSFQV